VEQGGRDQNLLPHSFGVCRERRAGVVLQVEERQKAVNSRAEPLGRKTSKVPDEREIFGAGEVGIEDGLFGDVPDLRLVSQKIVVDVLAIEENLPPGWLQQTGQNRDGRRLARSVRPEQADNPAESSWNDRFRTAGMAE
jgi:hypothetical protein